MSSKKKIAITIGDPSGVGAEVILAWAKNATQSFLENFEVIAHRTFLEKLPDVLSKREVGSSTFVAEAGKPSAEGCMVAKDSLETAAKGCIDNIYSAVVTAPISKYEMRKIGFDFAGQTEFFAARWGGEPVMCFAGEKLLVALATWHNPISEVPSLINEARLARAVKCADLIAKMVHRVKEPRIAVCGLNPHAGEDGILGREEIDVIDPILNKLRAEYCNLSRTLPPDTVFARMLKGEFDVIVSMYHDQALAPLKALEFDNAVNVSMNLPFLRTSPDHGTGYSIAGKGIASFNSFASAANLVKKAVE